MPDETPSPDGRLEHPEIRTEAKDVNFRWVLSLVLGAVVFAGVVHFVLWEFFAGYRHHQAAIKQSPFPLAPAPS